MSSAPCPKCGADMRVTNSRQRQEPSPRIVRRRECVVCLHRLTTVEIVEDKRVLVDITGLSERDRRIVLAVVEGCGAE